MRVALVVLGGLVGMAGLAAQSPPAVVPAVVIGEREAVFWLPLLADTVPQLHPGWQVDWPARAADGREVRWPGRVAKDLVVDEVGIWVHDTTTSRQAPLAARMPRLSRDWFRRGQHAGEGVLLLEPEPALTAEIIEGVMAIRLGRSSLLRALVRAAPDSVRVSLTDRTTALHIRAVQVQWVPVTAP